MDVIRLMAFHVGTRSNAEEGLVAETWIGPCPLGHEVDHLDFNPQHNAVSNLENRRRYLESGEARARINRYLESEQYAANLQWQRENGFSVRR